MIDDLSFRERYVGDYRGTQIMVLGGIENMTLRDRRIPRVRVERSWPLQCGNHDQSATWRLVDWRATETWWRALARVVCVCARGAPPFGAPRRRPTGLVSRWRSAPSTPPPMGTEKSHPTLPRSVDLSYLNINYNNNVICPMPRTAKIRYVIILLVQVRQANITI